MSPPQQQRQTTQRTRCCGSLRHPSAAAALAGTRRAGMCATTLLCLLPIGTILSSLLLLTTLPHPLAFCLPARVHLLAPCSGGGGGSSTAPATLTPPSSPITSALTPLLAAAPSSPPPPPAAQVRMKAQAQARGQRGVGCSESIVVCCLKKAQLLAVLCCVCWWQLCWCARQGSRCTFWAQQQPFSEHPNTHGCVSHQHHQHPRLHTQSQRLRATTESRQALLARADELNRVLKTLPGRMFETPLPGSPMLGGHAAWIASRTRAEEWTCCHVKCGHKHRPTIPQNQPTCG